MRRGSEGACAHADYFGDADNPGKVIRIATDRSWNCDHALAHEIGHVLKLANALDEADKPCGGSDPGGGGTDRCTDHPNTPGCPGYCANNPDAPGCGTVTTQGVVCIPLYGLFVVTDSAGASASVSFTATVVPP